MKKIIIGEKEFTIKFGYEATLKTRLLSKLSKNEINGENKEAEALENIEDMLLFLPEFLLIGLQKFHSDDFKFDYETGNGKEEQLEKVFALVDEYCETDENDPMTLFTELQEELLSDGFLARMFQKLQKIAEEQAKKQKPSKKKEN